METYDLIHDKIAPYSNYHEDIEKSIMNKFKGKDLSVKMKKMWNKSMRNNKERMPQKCTIKIYDGLPFTPNNFFLV